MRGVQNGSGQRTVGGAAAADERTPGTHTLLQGIPVENVEVRTFLEDMKVQIPEHLLKGLLTRPHIVIRFSQHHQLADAQV